MTHDAPSSRNHRSTGDDSFGVGVRVAISIAALTLLVGCASDHQPRFTAASGARGDFSYVIPAGTGARIDAGEKVAILPAHLSATVGQTIRIENDDDRWHVVGPFSIAPHQTLSQRFSSPGTIVGMCSVHPSGEVRIDVKDV